MFNYTHSSLRMVIERCFGVLKARFPILKLMPPYKSCRQRLIAIACCAIHNFIRKWGLRDELFREWENMDSSQIELSNESTNAEFDSNVNNFSRLTDQAAMEMANFRDYISNWMWLQYNHSNV